MNLKLTCGNHIEYVQNCIFITKYSGKEDNDILFVNNGKDDLYDIGFTVQELESNILKIESVNKITEEIS